MASAPRPVTAPESSFSWLTVVTWGMVVVGIGAVGFLGVGILGSFETTDGAQPSQQSAQLALAPAGATAKLAAPVSAPATTPSSPVTVPAKPIAEQEPPPSSPVETGVPIVQSTPATNEIGIAELVSVSRNPLAAEKKYGGKQLQLSGIIKGLTPSSVTLCDPTNQEAAVICHFGQNSTDYQKLRALAGVGRGGSNNPLDNVFSSFDTAMTRDVSGLTITVAGIYRTDEIGLYECAVLTSADEITEYVASADQRAKAAQEQAELDEEAAILAAKAVQPQVEQERSNSNFYDHDWDTFFETKVVEFTGTLDRMWVNYRSIEVDFAALDGKMGVKCKFHPRHRDRLEQLTPDTPVTIRGKATSWSIGNRWWVHLEPCVFVD